MSISRFKIEVTGVVQGVGFRPFIYNLATKLHLFGWVNNAGSIVKIEVEGQLNSLNTFVKELSANPPPAASIANVTCLDVPICGYKNFQIIKSQANDENNVHISADISICADCLRELHDPTNRRFKYPFISCTNCGPRFTIIDQVPYDRPSITLKKFTMCKNCHDEYTEPSDRRYHAQTISCKNCGPRLYLLNKIGENIQCEDPISEVTRLLANGNIVAIKGLGGFHIACDPYNLHAVETLRKRKNRPTKPFALMARDLDTAAKYCNIDFAEETLLTSSKKPIVLLKPSTKANIPPTHTQKFMGIMLPYTALQHLLFHIPENPIELLIMTSGNASNLPMDYKNADAISNLGSIVDYFLVHDMDINQRIDDSVTRIFMQKEQVIRYARGYAPSVKVMTLPLQNAPSILACGPQSKNTFCLNKNDNLYMSQYMGDLDNYETFNHYVKTVFQYEKLFKIRPTIIAYDMHPEYASTKFAQEQNIPLKVPVQHHHAHMVSCMIDNNLVQDVIGVVFDGTGYGEDGNIWGGEFFVGGYEKYLRMAHFKYVKMPGADAAVRYPWRMAASYLNQLASYDLKDIATILPFIEYSQLETIVKMMDKGVNCPLTSSMGRLFDAIAALLNICTVAGYDGEPAILLENAVADDDAGQYDFAFSSDMPYIIDVSETISGIIEDLKLSVPTGVIASKFHQTISNIVVSVCVKIRNTQHLSRVALSGGVFQNIILLNKCIDKLEQNGFDTYIHHIVPANDSGVSVGQLAIALARQSTHDDNSCCKQLL